MLSEAQELIMYRKMGLKGVRGIRYASVEAGNHPGPKHSNANLTGKHEFSRRMNHQGMPELGSNSMSHPSTDSEPQRSNRFRGRGSANHTRPTRGGRKPQPSMKA